MPVSIVKYTAITSIKTFCLAALLFLIPAGSIAQVSIETLVRQLIDNAKTGKIEAIDVKPLYLAENQANAISLLSSYFSDTSSNVREKAYSLNASIAKIAINKAIRKKAVLETLKACSDSNQIISKNCSRVLQQFRPEDFDTEAKEILRSLIRNSKNNRGQFVKLVAWLRLKDMEAEIADILNEKIPGKEKWAIQLALARMGNEASLNAVVSKVKSLPVNDDVILEAAPALVFTRQKLAFDYLITILNSDEKNCVSAHPDANEPMICGYRILELIAPAIKDFPIKTGASGDLVGDYKQNLVLARKWLAKNQFTINTDTF